MVWRWQDLEESVQMKIILASFIKSKNIYREIKISTKTTILPP